MSAIKALLIFAILLSPIPAQAATYYFSTSGDDSRTPAQAQVYTTPWQTIEKLNDVIATLSPGDKVLLKQGDVWNSNAEYGADRRVYIGADGTSGSRIVIGMYLSATGAQATRADVEGGATRPRITGDRDLDDGYDRPSPPPTGNRWLPLVEIDGDYVTFQNITVDHSTGQGVWWQNAASGLAHNLSIYNCQSYGIAISGDLADNGIIEYCTLHNLDEWMNYQGRSIWCLPSCPVGGAGINIQPDAANTIIRYNTLYAEEGEGIGLYYGCDNAVVEHNKTYNVRKYHIYSTGSANCQFRYNLVFMTGDAAWPT